MKAVLISIHTRFCENIAKGGKTVEVRKTAPKIPTPFKCYIYQTKGMANNKAYGFKTWARSGKVIGEFVCDEITHYEGEFWDDETYEAVRERYEPDDFEEYCEYEYETIADNEQENYKDVPLFEQSCLTWEELREYLGKGDHVFYGWHISDLKIYDKPRELGEFRRPLEGVYCTEHKAKDCSRGCVAFGCSDFYCKEYWDWEKGITRPPQSWCYVEEI